MKNTIIALMVVLSACSIKNSINVGCYEAKNDNSLTYLLITLSKDSSYVFFYTGDMEESTIRGHWKQEGNNLILNSDIQPTAKGYFTESQDFSAKGVELSLFDIDKKPLKNRAHVYVKHDTKYDSVYKASENIYLVNKGMLDRTFSVGIGREYQELKIALKNKNSNKINVYLLPEARGFYQTNEKFAIKDSSTLTYKKYIFKKIDCKR